MDTSRASACHAARATGSAQCAVWATRREHTCGPARAVQPSGSARSAICVLSQDVPSDGATACRDSRAQLTRARDGCIECISVQRRIADIAMRTVPAVSSRKR